MHFAEKNSTGGYPAFFAGYAAASHKKIYKGRVIDSATRQPV